MSDFLNAMLAGHDASIDILGASTLTFGGATYTGVAATALNTRDLEEAGYLAIADLQFDLDNTKFAASAIGNRSRVTIDGAAYEVLGIQTGKHSPVTHLILKLDR